MSYAFSKFEAEKRDFLRSLRRNAASCEKSASRCPEPRLLLAAREGVLPTDLQSAIQTHLRDCAECHVLQESLEEAQLPDVTGKQIKQLYARIQENLPAAAAPSRTSFFQSLWLWRLAPVAAAVLVMISLGVWYRQLHRDESRPTQIAVPVPTPVVQLASVVLLEPAPVELPLDALLVRRNSGADQHTLYIRKLAEALAPYRTGSYAQSAAGLSQVASAYPNAPEVHFYYGVCLLLIDRPGEAAQHLSRENLFIRTPWQRKASWYLGIAQLRSGDAAGAVNVFRRLCESKGERKENACEAVRSLLTITQNPAGR